MSRGHICPGEGCGRCERLIEQAEDRRAYGETVDDREADGRAADEFYGREL